MAIRRGYGTALVGGGVAVALGFATSRTTLTEGFACAEEVGPELTLFF